MNRETAIYLIMRTARVAGIDPAQWSQAKIDNAISMLLAEPKRAQSAYWIVDVRIDNLSIH